MSGGVTEARELERANASTPRASLALRALLSLAALAVAGAAASGALARRADLARLTAEARTHGLDARRGGELDRALRRAGEGGERRLTLARALVDAVARARAADGAGLASVPAATAALRAAGERAREALARLPASWEAAEIAGVALALERVVRRDPALLGERAGWQAPLEAARARSPGSPRPERALAAIWLEVWPGLSAPERAAARPALARAFADPAFFGRTFDRWLELAGSLAAAAELLPDRPESWRRLTIAAAERAELAGAAEFHVRWRRAVDAELERGLELARDEAAAIDRLVVAAPRDAALAPWLERALAARPAAPADSPVAESAARWLAWARPLCLTAGCPLSPGAFDRLAGLSGARLSPAEAAFAALAAGDEPLAEKLARRSEALWSAPWAPYALLVARRRIAAGDPAAARAALDRVHRTARPLWPYRALARAAGADGAEISGEAWESSEWEWEGGEPRLALQPSRTAAALVLRLARPAARPTLLVAEWNGRATPPVEVPAGASSCACRWR